MFASDYALAHSDMIGPLLIVEKVYGPPAPIGRITVRYDGTNEAEPTLKLSSNLFSTTLSAKLLRDLPRPNWNALSVPYSFTSIEPKTRKIIEQPYLYITVPLYGPAGQSWPGVSVEFHFDSSGKVSKRILKQFVPVKDKRPRLDLPHAEADYIDSIYENWPLDSRESAEAVLARAFKKIGDS